MVNKIVGSITFWYAHLAISSLKNFCFFGTNDLIMNIFCQTGDAASQLGEKGAYEIMEPQLKKLAAKHVSSGVADAHFEVKHPF